MDTTVSTCEKLRAIEMSDTPRCRLRLMCASSTCSLRVLTLEECDRQAPCRPRAVCAPRMMLHEAKDCALLKTKKPLPEEKKASACGMTLTQESTLGGSLDGRSRWSNDTNRTAALRSFSLLAAKSGRFDAERARGSICSERRFCWSSCARKGIAHEGSYSVVFGRWGACTDYVRGCQGSRHGDRESVSHVRAVGARRTSLPQRAASGSRSPGVCPRGCSLALCEDQDHECSLFADPLGGVLDATESDETKTTTLTYGSPYQPPHNQTEMRFSTRQVREGGLLNGVCLV